MGTGSITVVIPGVLRPASRTALLTCADATGRRYSIGTAGAAAAQHQRQRAARRGGDIRTHQRERIDRPLHRPLRKAGVAGEGSGDWMRGDEAHQQPCRRAAVAHVERRLRLKKGADADAVNRPASLAGALQVGAHRPHRGGRRQHVLAFEQTGYPALAHRQRRQHQRAMTDRFVAWHPDAPFERSARREPAGAHLRGVGCGHLWAVLSIGDGARLLTALICYGKARARMSTGA